MRTFRLIAIALVLACTGIVAAAPPKDPTPDVVIGCHCCFSDPSYCSIATKLGLCC